MPVRLGFSDHLGWAVVVAVSDDDGTCDVVDRWRIAMIGADLPEAPIHHVGGPYALHHGGRSISDEDLAALVAQVRASVRDTITAELERLGVEAPASIASIAIRSMPASFPTDIATLRRAPFESRADAVMYRQELAAAAAARGWAVHTFEARTIEAAALAVLGATGDPLGEPRVRLGPPWTRDHRMAYAAAVAAHLTPTERGIPSAGDG